MLSRDTGMQGDIAEGRALARGALTGPDGRHER